MTEYKILHFNVFRLALKRNQNIWICLIINLKLLLEKLKIKQI